jgi:phosphopantothenoylcysteine synthetase/decarboxylase
LRSFTAYRLTKETLSYSDKKVIIKTMKTIDIIEMKESFQVELSKILEDVEIFLLKVNNISEQQQFVIKPHVNKVATHK